MENKSKLEALERFEDSKDSFKLSKVASKKSVPMLEEDKMSVSGCFALVKSDRHNMTSALVADDYGYFIRTSNIINIIDQDSNSTMFETMGGIYRLEKI
jgi:hypothetical protein